MPGQDLRSDLFSALRQARRAPGATAFIVLSVALGIGTCTVLFCLVWALALRPLPFRAPRELLGLDAVPLAWSAEPAAASRLSAPDSLDLRTQNRSFTAPADPSGRGPLGRRESGPPRP